MRAAKAFEHQADAVAVGIGHHLDRGARQACDVEAALQAGDDGGRGVEAVGAAAQDRGIAGLEAEAAGIRRHVGPRFIDDADDADRHAHAAKSQAVGPASIPPSPGPRDRARRRSPPVPSPSPRAAPRVSVSRSRKLAFRSLALAFSRSRGVLGQDVGGRAADLRRHGHQRLVLLSRSAQAPARVRRGARRRAQRHASARGWISSRSCALSAHQHQVVAVDQFVAAPEAQHLLDLGGLEPDDARRVARIIGDEPARDLAAAGARRSTPCRRARSCLRPA